MQDANEGKRKEETAIKTARALRQAMIDKYQKKNGEFEKEYYSAANVAIREALDKQEKTYLNNIKEYDKILNDETIKAAASARPSDYVGATDEETDNTTPAAADSVEYTEDELKRINNALIAQIEKRFAALDEMGEDEKRELLNALKSADNQDDFKKALQRAENRAYSYEIEKSANATPTTETLSAEQTTQEKAIENAARAVGLDLTADELNAFRASLARDPLGNVGDIVAAAKVDTTNEKSSRVVSSAFGEVDYNADYKNKMYSKLEKIINFTESIKRNTENDGAPSVKIEDFNI